MGAQRVDPFEAAVAEVGDEWTFLLTREAFFGARRFGDFLEHTSIPRSRLSERLARLVAVGVFDRLKYQSNPERFEYRLTEKGLAIYPVALALLAWGDRWRPTENGAGPLQLTHLTCGKRLRVEMRCGDCGRPLDVDHIDWPTPGAQPTKNATKRRRRIRSVVAATSRPDSVARALDSLGGQWTMLVMHCALRGTSRFVDFEHELGIATNVLSDCLARLEADDVLTRRDQAPGSPAGYALTASGRDALAAVLTARHFGKRWCAGTARSTPRHTLCGARTDGILVCRACGEEVVATEVSYRQTEAAKALTAPRPEG